MEDARRAAAAWLDGPEALGPRLDAVRRAWIRRFGLAGVA